MKKYKLAILFLFSLTSCSDEDPGEMTSGEIPKITIVDASISEGNDSPTLTFQVRLSAASDQPVSVEYSTQDGTAVQNKDFIAASGTVNFSNGSTTASIDVVLVSDTKKELEEEFTISLSNPMNASLERSTAIGIITNDDTEVDIPEDGYITDDQHDGYNLLWSDEFSGTALNTDLWTHEIGDNGWGNNELQYYTDEVKNSKLIDGKLYIEAQKGVDTAYSSARIITMDKVEFKFGRIDVRAKMPVGQGIWPAVWMLGANFEQVGWPACGEIDIMEYLGHQPTRVHCTAHWGPTGSSSIQSTTSISNNNGFQNKFHVFSLVWTFNKLQYYVDEDLVHTVTPATTQGQNYPFNQEFFMIMNVAVGGNWPGSPDETTTFPQSMVVDYVRVFQRK